MEIGNTKKYYSFLERICAILAHRFRKVLDINRRQVYYLTKQCARMIQSRGNGCVKMRRITEKFKESTSIDVNEDVINAFEFIAAPDSVIEMISATLVGKPALSAIVNELEKRYANAPGFPLNHNAPDKNAKNRRNIGWMVRFVMREYGYTPVDNSERTRIGTDAGSQFFRNAAVYKRTNPVPNNDILSQAFVAYRDLTVNDLFMDKDDKAYKTMKEDVKLLNKRRKRINLTDDFICTFLHHTGFNKLISTADIGFIFAGVKTPRVELYESINNLVAFFEMFDTQKVGEYHEIFGPYTDKAKRAFYSLDIDKNKVKEVFVYFYSWDAILDGYYNLDGENQKDKLVPLVAPSMVIVTENDDYWFEGLTCGYAGTGCVGTQDILDYLDISIRGKYKVNREICSNRLLHYFREDNEWKYNGSESKYDLYDNFPNSFQRIYQKNDKLVLVQGLEFGIDEPEYTWFHASDYFLKDIKSIEFVRREDAIERGMVLKPTHIEYIFQIIVTDISGNELWMTYPFEKIADDRRINFNKYCESIGISAGDQGKTKSFIRRITSNKDEFFRVHER